MLQVVLDPPCLAHPAAGENDPAAAQRVEGHRILHAPRYDDPECLGVLLLPLVHLPGLRVEALGVAKSDPRGFGGQGRIDIDGEALDPALPGEIREQVQDVLRAAHGEGRNDHVAPFPAQGVRHGMDELLGGLLHPLVNPVPVGGLHHHHVRARNRRGIANDGKAPVAEVPGEHQSPLPASVAHGNGKDRGSEDVPRIQERGPDVGGRRNRLAVADRGQPGKHRERIRFRVEGRDVFFPRAPLLPALPLRLPFLDVAGVGKHHPEKVGRRGRRVDRAAIPFPHDPGKKARVVDVRVGAEDEIHRGGRNRELPRVLPLALPSPLEHPAVDEEPRPARLHQDAGPGDLPCPPEEPEVHAHGITLVRMPETMLTSTDPATAPKKPLM